ANGGTKIACLSCGQRLQVPMPAPSKTVLAPLVEYAPTMLQPGQPLQAAPFVPPGAIQPTAVDPSRPFPWRRVLMLAGLAVLLLLLIVFVVIISPRLGAPEILVILIFSPLYFLPSFVAGSRGHHNSAAIFVLNLLLGWSFIGWAIALVWAFTAVDRQRMLA